MTVLVAARLPLSRAAAARFLCCLLLVAATAIPTLADSVHLTNGDTISGKVVSYAAGALTIETSYAGAIAIDTSEVARVSTDEAVVLQLSDGREISGRIVTAAGGTMALQDGAGASVPLQLSQIASFAPPAPPAPWFQYSGEINAGFNAAKGNTDTQGYHVAGVFEPIFGKNGLSFTGQLNRSEAEVPTDDGAGRRDETTASNWRVLGQYNRELSEHWYAFFNNGWENDDLKDLNLRASAATGAGYEFWDDEMRFLTAELGPGYVYENFDRIIVDGNRVNPDRNYATGRWALDFDHGILRPDTRFYHNHTLLERVDDLDTFIFQSATGLKFTLIGAVNAGAEVQFDWNNDPAEGAREEDLRYLLRLGYAF